MSAADQDKNPEAVAAMFDETAGRYDAMNSVLSLGQSHLWRYQMTKAVAPKPGEQILDVAAGTGTSAAPMQRKGAVVTCLDLSAGMIAEGKRRHPELEFVQGSAEQLPFADASFDAVTISFGLRNVQHPEVALAEFHRVLVPGGRLVVCEFSQPPVEAVNKAYGLYSKTVMPVVSKLASNPESYDYLTESIEGWMAPEALSRAIRTAGFTRVAYRRLTLGVVALHRGYKAER